MCLPPGVNADTQPLSLKVSRNRGHVGLCCQLYPLSNIWLFTCNATDILHWLCCFLADFIFFGSGQTAQKVNIKTYWARDVFDEIHWYPNPSSLLSLIDDLPKKKKNQSWHIHIPHLHNNWRSPLSLKSRKESKVGLGGYIKACRAEGNDKRHSLSVRNKANAPSVRRQQCPWSTHSAQTTSKSRSSQRVSGVLWDFKES